jgi:hypothetical protein
MLLATPQHVLASGWRAVIGYDLDPVLPAPRRVLGRRRRPAPPPAAGSDARTVADAKVKPPFGLGTKMPDQFELSQIYRRSHQSARAAVAPDHPGHRPATRLVSASQRAETFGGMRSRPPNPAARRHSPVAL